MARFDTNGLDGLMISMERLAELPDNVVTDMLMAGGEVIAAGQRQELVSIGLVKTGTLKEAIQISKKRSTAIGARYVLVYPYGKHHTYRAKSGVDKEATNNDVGFVHEFGGHGNVPRNWMWSANEKHAEEAVDEEERVYDHFLKSNGL